MFVGAELIVRLTSEKLNRNSGGNVNTSIVTCPSVIKGFEWANYSSPYVVVVVMRMVAVSREVQSGEAAERLCSDWKGCLSFSPVVDVRGICLLK